MGEIEFNSVKWVLLFREHRVSEVVRIQDWQGCSRDRLDLNLVKLGSSCRQSKANDHVCREDSPLVKDLSD